MELFLHAINMYRSGRHMSKSFRYTLLFFATSAVLIFQACGKPLHSSSSSTSGSLGTPTATAFFKCSPNTIVGESQIKRLTKKEYLNTLSDLMAPIAASEKTALTQAIQSSTALLPEDNVGQYERYDSRISINHIKTQYDIAYVFAKRVILAANRSAFFGSCMNTTPPTATCVRTFISQFGLKTFRRPLQQAEIDEMYTFYVGRGTTGLTDLVARFLVHPRFLYHVETDGIEFSPRELRLTPYEIASRLSYLYLQSMPNTLLFSAAASGQLSTISGVQSVIDQLFTADEARIRTTIESYTSEWLEFKFKPGFANNVKVQSLANVVGLTGTPDNNLRSAMLKELQEIVSHYTWDQPDGNFSDLMNGDVSIVQDARLAGIYGVPTWTPGQPPNRLPSSERSGIFTRAGSIYSGTEKTSPIHYGVNIIRKVLCDDIPNPTQAIIDDALRDPTIDYVNKTQREIVHEMTASSKCMTCHKVINPYGFAAESYDSLGGYRKNFMEYKFDTSGNVINTLTTNSTTDVSINNRVVTVNNAVQMNAEISNSGKAHACFVRNFYRFAQRRAEDDSTDSCGMQRIYTDLTRPGGSLKSMFKAMGSDMSFLNRKVGE